MLNWQLARTTSCRMVQTTKGGEKSGGTPADPLGAEVSLDLAEELFVSCRFTEAASVCVDALSASSTSTAARNDGRRSSIPASELADSALVVAFDDQVIAPVGECETSDLIVAVLLQCGFELRRTEEWRRCRAFYGEGGAMPFAVATLWLRLRLAGGEFELVRRVLWQLRAALGEELAHHTTTTVDADNMGAGDSYISTTTKVVALANYAEATEMLVVQIMLPCRESVEASELVSKDTHLGIEDKVRLLNECELSAIRIAEQQGSGITAGGGARRSAGSTHAAGGGDSHSHQGRARRASTGRPENNGHTNFDRLETPADGSRTARHEQQQQQQQQWSVLEFLPDVSDWTPEARIQLVVGAGTAGLAAYAALRHRGSLWRAARNAAGVAARTAGDIGAFIVGSS